VRRTGINDWYVPRDSDMRVNLEGRLPVLPQALSRSPFRHVREAMRRVRPRPCAARGVTAVGRYSEPDKTRSTQVRSRGCQAAMRRVDGRDLVQSNMN